MRNKLLHSRGTMPVWMMVLAVLCLGAVSCQKKYSPMDTIEKMADKNIPGSYSCVVVDQATMQTAIREYVLKADGSADYRSALAGDNTPTLVTASSANWSRGEYVDNNAWVNIHVDFPAVSGLESQVIKWGSASLKIGEEIFSKGTYINNVDGIYESFANHTFAKADTTFFSRVDTVLDTYLAWTQAKGAASKLTEAQIAEKREYFAQQWVKDTIAWYNANHLPMGSKPVPDSISVGKKSGNTYICVYYIGEERTDSIPVTVHLGEAKVDCSQFHFDRSAANANTGEFVYHFMQQDSAHFVDPTQGKLYYDSLVTLTINHWCISKPTSTGAFELMGSGTETTSVEQLLENGTIDKKSYSKDVLKTFNVVGFYAGEEVTIDGKKHIFVK